MFLQGVEILKGVKCFVPLLSDLFVQRELMNRGAFRGSWRLSIQIENCKRHYLRQIKLAVLVFLPVLCLFVQMAVEIL